MAFETWPLMVLFIDLPFFLFSISMIYFLIKQICKNNQEFNSGFYKLFIFLAINDSLLYFESLLINRIPLSGAFMDFYLGNSTLLHVWENFSYTLNGFMTSIDLIGHTTIAFNRFTTMFLSQHYNYLWSGRRLFLIIISIFLLSLLSISYRIYGPFQYILTDNGIVTMYDSQTIRQIFPIERTIFTIVTSAITLIFEAATAIKYRLVWKKLNPNTKVRNKKDLQLFTHSILVCIAQNMLVSYFVVYWISVWYSNNNNVILQIYQKILFIIYDLLCLGPPVFLFCVSSVVRECYLDFYGINRVMSFFKSSTVEITHIF